MTSWYEAGVAPVPGQRYEFEDFVGARFTATLAAWMELPGGWLRLVFDDHPAIETNLPIRFRDAA